MTVVGIDRSMRTGTRLNAAAKWSPIHSALGAGIDSGRLGPDVTAVDVTPNGTILLVSRDADSDITPYVHYLAVDSYHLPSAVDGQTPVVARDQLVETGRFAPWVDAVRLRSKSTKTEKTEKAVFKYYSDNDGIPRIWAEVQCLARLSGHPNVTPL